MEFLLKHRQNYISEQNMAVKLVEKDVQLKAGQEILLKIFSQKLPLQLPTDYIKTVISNQVIQLEVQENQREAFKLDRISLMYVTSQLLHNEKIGRKLDMAHHQE